MAEKKKNAKKKVAKTTSNKVDKAKEVKATSIAKAGAKETALTKISAELSDSPDILWLEVSQLGQVVSISIFEMGRRLIVLKEKLKHGEFLEGLENRNISHTSAKRAMLAHRKFSDDEIDLEAQTVFDLEFDAVDRMSVRELKDALRKAKEANKQGAKQLEQAEEKVREAQQKLSISPYHDEEIAKRCEKFIANVAGTMTGEFGNLDLEKMSPQSARTLTSALVLAMRGIHDFKNDIYQTGVGEMIAEEEPNQEDAEFFMKSAEKWFGFEYQYLGAE